MSATDIELELTEFETSNSTLNKTDESYTSVEKKQEPEPGNTDSLRRNSFGVGLKKYDIDKYYRGKKK